MFDPITLDQLRALVAVVEEGSFSAAARKLSRVQSAISTSMANLESQLGVTLWDGSARRRPQAESATPRAELGQRNRAPRVARLTEQGRAVLGAARRVLAEVDGLRRLTSGMARGLEPSVSLCVDALFPLRALTDLCVGFAAAFPAVDLRIDTQVMSAVSARVLRGAATIGVVSPLGVVPGLERKVLSSIRMIPVVSPRHALAPHARARATSAGRIRPIPTRRLEEFVQIVLTERLLEDDTGGAAGKPDQAVLSSRTWRVGDLHTKHEMLRAGLGWGNLPEHVAREDLRARRLVAIRPEAWAEDEHTLHLSAIYRGDTMLGPAHQWVLAELATLCALHTGEPPRGRQSSSKTSAGPSRGPGSARRPRSKSA